MKTIKASEATNTQLDWLVATVEGEPYSAVATANGIGMEFPATNYTTDPAQMWPIIHREVISVFSPSGEPTSDWVASRGRVHQWGGDGLIAAARCYIVSKLGETVEVPEELT